MIEWKTTTLGVIGTLQAGVGFPLHLQGKRVGQYPFAKVGDISRVARAGLIELGSAEHYVDDSDLKELKVKPLPSGTIVFAKIGEAISQNYRAITGTELLIDNNAMGIIPDTTLIDRGYLFHFLRTVDFYRLADKTSVPSIRKSTLEKVKIPLPPIPEQQRITAILDKADELRAKRRSAIAKLDSFAQSIFFDMFGDPVRNEKNWERAALGSLLEAIESGWSPVCLDRPATDSEWGVLKLGAVTWCVYDDTEQKALPAGVEPRPELEVKSGDLLFTRKNTHELVAATAYVRSTRPNLMLSDLIFRFRILPDAPVEPVFLQQLLINPSKRRQIQRLASGSAGSMPNISKERLSTAAIELPPIKVQREYARRLWAIEPLRLSSERSLEILDSLIDSLEHRAFRGEL